MVFLRFSAVAESVKYSRIAKPNWNATPAPLAVIKFPSQTTESSVIIAPFKYYSKPGKQAAFLCFKKLFLPIIEGAAQIAAIRILLS
mgnify:CR=1 FL=1